MNHESVKIEIAKINSQITDTVCQFIQRDDRGEITAKDLNKKLHVLVKDWYIRYRRQDRVDYLMAVVDRLKLEHEDPEMVDQLMQMVGAVARRRWHTLFDSISGIRHYANEDREKPFSVEEINAVDELSDLCLSAIEQYNEYIFYSDSVPEYMGRNMYSFLDNFDDTLNGRCGAMSMFHGMLSRYFLRKYMVVVSDLITPYPDKNYKEELDVIADWVCREIGGLNYHQLEQHCHSMLDFCEDREMSFKDTVDTGLRDSILSSVFKMCSIAM